MIDFFNRIWMLLLVFGVTPTYGQLSVTYTDNSSNSIQTIVQSLVGEGVVISNITSNQPVFADAYGSFFESTNALGIQEGLLMTSGSIINAVGPNGSSSASTTNNQGSTFDLEIKQSFNVDSIYDPCVIEFDITTNSKEISFNYIFASEEYPEFVGSQYNDVFGFFISGPGILGKKNLAVLPLTNIPVAINNVNQNLNTNYYNSNGDGLFGGGTIIQYDGYTIPLRAVTSVVPCATYHIKLIIADVGDAAYDSGVFIEAGSISGSEGIYIGSLLAPDSLNICTTELPITLKAGLEILSSYTWKKDNILLPATSQFLPVTTSGYYKVEAQQGLGCIWKDSVEIIIDEAFLLNVNKDTAICIGESVPLEAIVDGPVGPVYHYQWSPSIGLTNANIHNPIATPVNSTDYLIAVSAGKCVASDTVSIVVYKPINLIAPTVVKGCLNESIQLLASGAEKYSWTPSFYLNNPNLANPLAIINTPTFFTVTGFNDCFSDQKTIEVIPNFKPLENAYGDTAICFGGVAQLRADVNPLYSYTWSPATGLSSSSSYAPTANPLVSQAYVLSIENDGCVKYDTVMVNVGEKVVARIFQPKTIDETPWKVKFKNFSTGAISYVWYITTLDSLTEKEPTVLLTKEGNYEVVLKAINLYGCADYDTLLIKAYTVFIPNLFTPNGDNHNDKFVITGLGEGFEMEVFNRWGDRVYKNSNYRNEWDGNNLSDGIYYFKIIDQNADKEYTGWVQITR